MDIKWMKNYVIKVDIVQDEVIISANSEGLESMANIFKELADSQNAIGAHIHLDQYNSLEDGSKDVIIVKIK